MRKPRILINFGSYTDANLKKKADFILQSMTGSAVFTNPIPTLAVVQAAIDAYSAALVNAATSDRNAVAVKNECRATLIGLLKQLGMYVMIVANGNITDLTSSGFTLAKTPAPVYITAPGSPIMSIGVNAGQLKSAVPRVPGAKLYFHQITPDPLTDTSNWQSIDSSRSKNTFTSLDAGKKYWVRVVANGSGGQQAMGPAAISPYIQ
jgi:hypothetical protein